MVRIVHLAGLTFDQVTRWTEKFCTADPEKLCSGSFWDNGHFQKPGLAKNTRPTPRTALSSKFWLNMNKMEKLTTIDDKMLLGQFYDFESTRYPSSSLICDEQFPKRALVCLSGLGGRGPRSESN